VWLLSGGLCNDCRRHALRGLATGAGPGNNPSAEQQQTHDDAQAQQVHPSETLAHPNPSDTLAQSSSPQESAEHGHQRNIDAIELRREQEVLRRRQEASNQRAHGIESQPDVEDPNFESQDPELVGGIFEDDGGGGKRSLQDSYIGLKTTSLMVDTGACRTAVDRSAFAAHLERSDVKNLRTVTHEPIRVYGEQQPSMVSRGSGRLMTTRALVTDTKQNVLSVGEGTDHGNWYVFGPGGVHFMTQLPLSIRTKEHREDFRRTGNQYFMDVGELTTRSCAIRDLVIAHVDEALDNAKFKVGYPSPQNPGTAPAPKSLLESIDEGVVDADDVEPGGDPLDAEAEDQSLENIPQRCTQVAKEDEATTQISILQPI
jgi:hypothetical protein